jgi:alcohol dehydrogenase YqhD (iron-dependent ADH family)
VASGQSVLVIRNTGNVRIANLKAATLTCGGGSPIDLTSDIGTAISNLDPGKTAAATFQIQNAVPGETCTLSITANAANGATVAASASAIIRP